MGLLTIKEACNLLKTPDSTIRDYINNNMVRSNISIIDEDNLYKLIFTCVLKHKYQKNINESLIYSNDSKLEMLISTPIFITL